MQNQPPAHLDITSQLHLVTGGWSVPGWNRAKAAAKEAWHTAQDVGERAVEIGREVVTRGIAPQPPLY